MADDNRLYGTGLDDDDEANQVRDRMQYRSLHTDEEEADELFDRLLCRGEGDLHIKRRGLSLEELTPTAESDYKSTHKSGP